MRTNSERSPELDMQPVRQLVMIKHGSHLYGTSTPDSDLDFKGVHLPSGVGIVMQQAEDVIQSGVTAKEGTKNTKDAVDRDSYSLQKFLGMLAAGDTVATEILFAPPEMIVEMDPIWPQVQAEAKAVLNRKAKGFVGYCQRQAAKYGIKGSRMAAVKALIELLVTLPHASSASKLGDYERELRAFAERQEHASFENIPSPNGTDLWHLVCCDRKMPMTAAVDEAIKVYKKVWDNYGERARAAMTNQGIDWKAMSHAVRVAEQAIELLTTQHITFPRPNARDLLQIKLGALPYDMVSRQLERLVARVHEASAASSLPEESDMVVVNAIIFVAYSAQLEPIWRFD